jgi:trehalose 6-phosphate phosphatase
VGGKQVVNIVPARAPHKGAALERERARRRCTTAIYVGDDETDEDVFTLGRPEALLTIRVGRRRSSAAAYYLRSQREIDALLRALARLRRAPPAPIRRPGSSP